MLVGALGRFVGVVGSGAEAILSSRREGKKVGLFPAYAVPDKKAGLGWSDISDDDSRSPADTSEDERSVRAPYAVQRIIVYLVSLWFHRLDSP